MIAVAKQGRQQLEARMAQEGLERARRAAKSHAAADAASLPSDTAGPTRPAGN